MEIRASFDAATLNLAANVAKLDGMGARWAGGAGYLQVCAFKKKKKSLI